MARVSPDAPKSYDKAFFLGYESEEVARGDLEWLREAGKLLAGARVEHRVIEHRAKEASPRRCDHYLVVLHEEGAPPFDWNRIIRAMGGRARAARHGTAGPRAISVNFSRTDLREGFEISLGGTVDEPEIPAEDGPEKTAECTFCGTEVGESMGVLDDILDGGSGIHAIARLGNHCTACDHVVCAKCALDHAKEIGALGFVCPDCDAECEAWQA